MHVRWQPADADLRLIAGLSRQTMSVNRQRDRFWWPVRGSRSGKPIMALLDLIGRRWTLRILWELRESPLKARALRSRCDDASPSSLNARLIDLRQAGLVTLEKGAGYCLTDQGMEFIKVFLPLHAFAERWSMRDQNE